jgi:GTP cyclohydrolase I
MAGRGTDIQLGGNFEFNSSTKNGQENLEGLKDTPKRVAKAWIELTDQQNFNLTTFSSEGYDEMIISRNIKYYTFCEHHLLPFFGKAHIGYIPDKKIVGLSKLARTVEYYSKTLNTQEYFTDNIANKIEKALKPKGIGVVVEGRHMCQEMRGIKKEGNMITSCLKGIFRDDLNVKKEFLSLVKGE